MNGSASKTSLILSPCTHWMSSMATSESFTSEEAIRGTEIHKAIEDALLISDVTPNDLIVEYGLPVKEFVENLRTELGTKTRLHVEVSMYAAIDGKAAQCGRDDNYGAAREFYGPGIGGTADLIVLASNGTGGACEITVIDWKSGNPMFARNQLLTLGAMASKIWAVGDSYSVRCMSFKVEPGRVSAGLDFRAEAKELHDHLGSVLKKVADGPSKPVVGAHCYEQFCPHREECKGIKSYYYSYETTKSHDSLTDEQLYRQIVANKTLEDVAKKRRLHMLKVAETRGGLYLEEGHYTESFRETARTSSEALTALALKKGATLAEIEACSTKRREPAGWKMKKVKDV